MTEVNGLRLAYRGLVSGLAGGYVWAAIAMTLSTLAHGDPLRPLRPVAGMLMTDAARPELAFVIGLFVVQAGGALAGMCFAYFFGRFFTVRPTLAVAGPCFALLVWAIVVGTGVGSGAGATAALEPITVLATVGFGLLLGAAVPLRGEVTRYSGSPST